MNFNNFLAFGYDVGNGNAPNRTFVVGHLISKAFIFPKQTNYEFIKHNHFRKV